MAILYGSLTATLVIGSWNSIKNCMIASLMKINSNSASTDAPELPGSGDPNAVINAYWKADKMQVIVFIRFQIWKKVPVLLTMYFSRIFEDAFFRFC